MEIKLPDLGEGIEFGNVVAILVKSGERVEADDAVIEIETDKAVVPVPAAEAGVVSEIKVSEGDQIRKGDVIALLSATENTQPAKIKSSETKKTTSAAEKAEKIEFILPELGEGIEGGLVISVLAKAGEAIKKDETLLELETDKALLPVPSPVDALIREIKVSEHEEIKVGQLLAILESKTATSSLVAPPENSPATTDVAPTTSKEFEKTKQIPPPQIPSGSPDFTPASPAARKLARELGVVLKHVSGSARGGRVSLEDIKAYVKSKMLFGSSSQGQAPLLPELADFHKFGKVRREKISKLRKTISERMGAYWSNIPHVHQFQDVDITNIVELQKKLADKFKEEGSSLSVTQFLIKGLALGLKDFPIFNSSYDPKTSEVLYKEYFHIGVAVDTPSGLIVPVLRDVDRKSIFLIGKELKDLAKRTRERKVSVEELQGACMTLSNLGGIGGTHFTPIINYPEVAILGAGRSNLRAVWKEGAFQPRTILPLCLAYDHRVVDGADGARFIVRLTEYLENVEYHLMH